MEDAKVHKALLQNYRLGEDLSRTTTPEQRIDMMWHLVVEEYARRGTRIDESQFRRDIEGVVRGNQKNQ